VHIIFGTRDNLNSDRQRDYSGEEDLDFNSLDPEPVFSGFNGFAELFLKDRE
jgi:hypothetical protein